MKNIATAFKPLVVRLYFETRSRSLSLGSGHASFANRYHVVGDIPSISIGRVDSQIVVLKRDNRVVFEGSWFRERYVLVLTVLLIDDAAMPVTWAYSSGD